MKHLLFLLLLLPFCSSYGQTTGNYDDPKNNIKYRRLQGDTTFHVPMANFGNPVRDLTSNIHGGAIAFDAIRNKVVYSTDGITYNKILVDSLSASVNTVTMAQRVFIEGQSNAYGIATYSSLAAAPLMNLINPFISLVTMDFSKQFERVYIADSFGGYKKLKLGVGANNNYGPRDSTQFGPEVGFAYRWLIQNPTGILLIDKIGIQGADIGSFLGSAYNTYMRAKRDSSNRWCAANGLVPNDAGWIWLQGESNSTDTKAAYEKLLDSVIKNRRTFGIFKPDTRLVFSRVSKVSVGYGAGVDSAFTSEVTKSPYYRIINNDSLMNIGAIHYDARQILQLSFNGFAKIFDADSILLDTVNIVTNRATMGYLPLVIGTNSKGIPIMANSQIYDSLTFMAFGGTTNPNYKYWFTPTVGFKTTVQMEGNAGVNGTLSVGTAAGLGSFLWNSTDGLKINFSGSSTNSMTINNISALFKVVGDSYFGNIVTIGNYLGIQGAGSAPTTRGMIIQGGTTDQNIYTTGGTFLTLQTFGQNTKIGGDLYMPTMALNGSFANIGGFLVWNSVSNKLERATTIQSSILSGTDVLVSSNSASIISATGDIYYTYTGVGTSTWTLPTVANGTHATYFIKNRGAAIVTINTNAGANDIYDATAVATINVAAGASLTLHNDGTKFNVL